MNDNAAPGSGGPTTTTPVPIRGVDEWLVAIDLDGTTLDASGQASLAVKAQLHRVEQAGHHLLVATGRSKAAALTVLDEIEVWPEYVVCSNGGMVLARDHQAPTGYRHRRTASFDVFPVVDILRRELPSARFAVEDEHGDFLYTHRFPPATTEPEAAQTVVPFGILAAGRAIRVVAIAPDWDVLSFRAIAKGLVLPGASFSLGWTPWLDIAARGVNKASAAEELRVTLGFGRDRVMAVGDGYNDIELIRWAAERGRGVAMGQSPESLFDVASEITGSIEEDGLASALARL